MTEEKLVSELTTALVTQGRLNSSGLVLILDEWHIRYIVKQVLAKVKEAA